MLGLIFISSLLFTIVMAFNDPSWIVLTILILCVGMFIMAFIDDDKLKEL